MMPCEPDPEPADDSGWRFIQLLVWLSIGGVFVYAFAIYGFIHFCSGVADKLMRLIP